MFYDLNLSYSANHVELQRTLAFSAELGYHVVALNHNITGKLPPEIVNAVPSPLPFSVPPSLTVLRRCTMTLSDPTQNARLGALTASYDILALRPVNEKTLGQACHDLDCDVISLDLSIRYPFYFKHKMVADAVSRGIKFEICYAQGIQASDGGQARRNLISNATGLIRASRGRGIIISSDAKRALTLRGPSDVVNLACVWGLGQDRGTEGIGREARSVVVQAGLKRTGYRGVVDILYGGEKPEIMHPKSNISGQQKDTKCKRKAEVVEDVAAEPKPISKREQKRRAKKARLEAADEVEGKKDAQ